MNRKAAGTPTPHTMVLSQLLAPLLAKALGSFVKPECLEEDSLRVGIWRGHVQLSNICLRDDLLDLLGLPLTLRFARCVWAVGARACWAGRRSRGA